MIGETSVKSGPQQGGSKTLRTFGDSGPRKRGYDKFGESDGDLDMTVLDGEEHHVSDSRNDSTEPSQDQMTSK